MLIISHLELSLLELSILWANWWHWPHFTDKQIELRAVHSFAQGFVDMSSRAHSATSLCKKHSETERMFSLGRKARFSSQMSSGRCSSLSERERSFGRSPRLWHSRVSQIRSSPEALWFANQVFPISSDLLFHFHSALLPEPGLLGHSVRENKQICSRISTFSKHTEGRWEMHLIF